MSKEETLKTDQISEQGQATEQKDDMIVPDQKLPDDPSVEESIILAKSEFLGTMSQEIQTQMNQIIGMTELTLSTKMSEEQAEYLSLIKSAATSLLDLLNGILDFSKIETGDVKTESIQFNLCDCLENPLKTLSQNAEINGLTFTSSIDENIPKTLVGDPTRLRQIIINLLGHEIKTTISGTVYLGIRPDSQDQDKLRLRFTIGDTGPNPGEDENVTSIFSSNEGSALKFGGTDFDWEVTLQLIRLMGGQVTIQKNRTVNGVALPENLRNMIEFVLCFSVPKKESGDNHVNQPLDLKGIPVLVVDDCPNDRQRLNDILSLWEMKPQTARHALEAMVKLEKAHASGEPFALAILDANMPEIDGYALAKEIRQMDKLADTKLIVITSAAMRGDGQRCRELGISAYLPKPVDQSDLLHAIMAVMVQNDESLVTRHSLKEARTPLRVLLVEDNPMNQKYAVRLLEKWGHHVTIAGTGREAVAENARTEYDLILMDISMPEMDGVDATRIIRQQCEATGRSVKIVSMSASLTDDIKKRCEQVGMDGYLQKPVRIDELYNVIKKTVADKENVNIDPRPEN